MKRKSLITIFYLLITCSFAQTTVSGDITGNTTWTLANSPYELNGVVTVAAGITLTIEPGVEVQAVHYSHNLIVNGALVAEGTNSDSIRFTGPGMHIEAVGTGSSFDYVLFEGLGAFNNAAVQIFSDDVTVQHSSFETCEVGISVHSNSSPSITDSRFFDSHDYGIRVFSGSPTIENNVIDGQSGSAAGVIIGGGKPTIRNNDISNVAQNQTSYGIIIDYDSEAPIIENNTFSNNNRDLLTHPHLASDTIFDTNGLSELYIDNKNISQNTTWPLPQAPESWTYVKQGGNTIDAGVTLTIEPGVVVQSTNYTHDIIINGTLIAEGTMTDSITFIGSEIHVEAASTGTSIDHVIFQSMGAFNQAALQLSTSDVSIQRSNFKLCEVGISIHNDISPVISNCRFFDSHDYGIRVYNGTPTIENNVIDGNSGSTGGVIIEGGKPTIRNNDISNVTQNQTSYGIILDHDGAAPILENNTLSNNSREILTHPHLVNDTIFDTNGISEIFIDNINITQNTMWHLPQSPESWTYTKEGGNTIDAGVILTIEPGVEVRSTNYTHDIIVNGTLIAEGTMTDSITFIGSEIHVEAVSTGTSFDHVNFQSMGAFNQAALQLSTSDVAIQRSNFELCEVGISIHNDVSPVISNCRFFDSHDYGLRVYDGTPTIENNVIDGNAGSTGGVIIQGGKPTIRNNDISNVSQNQTSYGIILDHDGAAPILENNILSNNSREILTHPHLVNDTIFDTNGISEIFIDNKNITQNTTWHKVQSPEAWTFQALGSISAVNGVTLTLEPGFEINLTNYIHDIVVEGTLIANGTVSDSIKINGPGGIDVSENSANSQISYLRYQGVGATSTGSTDKTFGAGISIGGTNALVANSSFLDTRTGIVIYNNAQPIISESTFNESSTTGITSSNGSPTITNCIFENHSIYGVELVDGSATLQGNTFLNSGTAIFILNVLTNLVIENNSFTGNSRDITTNPELLDDELYDDNGLSTVHVSSRTINNSTTWHKVQSPETWKFQALGRIPTANGVILTLEPGFEINLTNYTHDVEVEGTLIANGTAADSIKINGPGGIDISENSNNSEVAYLRFEGVGATSSGSTDRTFGGGLSIGGSNATVSNSRFLNSALAIAIYNNASPTISSCQIETAANQGIRVVNGNSSPTIENSCFSNISFHAVQNLGTGTINATNNWWGDPSGPLNIAANPSGLGEEVSDGVTFDPWLTIDPCQLQEISIESQPTNQNVCQEANLNLSVTASGTTNLQYQWQEDQGAGFTNLSDDAAVSGATSSDLTISSVQSSLDGTQYRCVISGDHASDVISDTVSLDVLTLVSITDQPNGMEITVGEEAVFTVNASGDGLSYQWQKDANDIAGANSNSLTIASVGTQDAGFYRCVVSGSCNETTSVEVTLDVCVPVSISNQSSDMVSVCEGENHTFSITEQGDPTISYEWYKDGTLISAASNSTYELINTNESDDGQYKVIVTNDCGKDSAFFQLDILPSPVVTSHPIDQTLDVGSLANFSVTSSGNNLSYQWKKDDVDIEGATSSTLTINSIELSDAGAYSCNVTNDCGTVTSNVAMLTVNEDPLSLTNSLELTIYPNPASDVIHIDGLSYHSDLNVSFIDMSGRRVRQSVLDSNHTLDVSSMLSGVYWLTVADGEKELFRYRVVLK